VGLASPPSPEFPIGREAVSSLRAKKSGVIAQAGVLVSLSRGIGTTLEVVAVERACQVTALV